MGNELNIIRKSLDSVDLRGVLCFPDVYDVGMSHYGLQMLYHIVNSRERWALGRAFHPWPDAETIMRREGIALYCLEYRLPLATADWVGFSVQYELQYANIVNMLDLGGIPVWSSDRGEGDPLIVLGGPCMGNPEPLADIADAIVIGDGEEAIVALCEALEDAKKRQIPRSDRLTCLAAIPGVYVPALFPVEKRGVFDVPRIPAVLRPAKVNRLSPDAYPSRPLVPLIEVVHHRLAVEIMRGCTRGCRFCSAGTFYRPVRERTPAEIMATITGGMQTTGWREVGLLSLSTADYSQISGLLASARDLTRRAPVDISLPSTRIDALTPEQFALLCAVSPPSSLTIAPEAGSQRLRNVINKGFTDQQIIETVTTLFARNIQTLKLYFMIGLPTETREDLDALIALVSTIAGMASPSGRRMVNVALSPFSPKPHTPFQWEGMDPPAVLDDKCRYVKDALRRRRNVRISYREAGMTYLETVLARGDRSAGRLVVAAWRLGARLDGWDEHFDLARWRSAAESLGMDLDTYTREITDTQPLPWQGVSTGVTAEFLRAERDAARRAEPTGDCRVDACSLCGACATPRAGICGLAGGLSPEPAAPAASPRPPALRVFYRFVFRKGREIRFLGHLDMVGVIHRAFGAANLPVAFSQGFSPLPRLSFGPPLALGAAGEAEIFDAEMTALLVNDQWQAPNAWLPEGLRLVACRLLDARLVAVSTAMTAARYRFLPLVPVDGPVLQERVAALLAASSLPVQVEKKGVTTEKDIRPLIYRAAVVEESPGSWTVEALLSAIGGRTCKPAELLCRLFPDRRPTEFLVTRLECLGGPPGKWERIG